MSIDPLVDRILLGTIDPSVCLDGKPIPAMTTMLYRVCDNDPTRFTEANRLVGLFIAEALAVANVEAA